MGRREKTQKETLLASFWTIKRVMLMWIIGSLWILNIWLRLKAQDKVRREEIRRESGSFLDISGCTSQQSDCQMRSSITRRFHQKHKTGQCCYFPISNSLGIFFFLILVRSYFPSNKLILRFPCLGLQGINYFLSLLCFQLCSIYASSQIVFRHSSIQ